jgi:hypothetical protein
MKQRIHELAFKVFDEFDPGAPGTYIQLDIEKFAKLIANDVAQFVEDKFDFCGDEIVIAEKIREQYGVEK